RRLFPGSTPVPYTTLFRSQDFELVDELRECLCPGRYVVDEAGRHVLMHAAWPEVCGMEAGPAHPLVELHENLALLEAPEQRRHRADVERERGHVEQVIQDARDQ